MGLVGFSPMPTSSKGSSWLVEYRKARAHIGLGRVPYWIRSPFATQHMLNRRLNRKVHSTGLAVIIQETDCHIRELKQSSRKEANLRNRISNPNRGVSEKLDPADHVPTRTPPGS